MISISTAKDLLDPEFITGFLSQTYWANGRTQQRMQLLIDNSLNFGVYLHDKQIGYARVVTDYGQFAYLMDVFITPEHQGKGYSKQLMKFILEHPVLQEVPVIRLATQDAHQLYRQFGFTALSKPENMMELMK